MDQRYDSDPDVEMALRDLAEKLNMDAALEQAHKLQAMDDEQAIGPDLDTPLTVKDLAAEYPLAPSTISQAAREGRVEAEQVGGSEGHAGLWLITRRAMNEAIKAGRLRPRK